MFNKLDGFLRGSKYHIMNVFSVIMILDVILIVSTDLSKSLSDIIYLNILLVLVSISSLVLSYWKWRCDVKIINEIDDELNDFESIESVGYYGKSLKANIEKIVLMKEEELCSKKDSIKEIYDYISKWAHEIKIPIAVMNLILERIETGQPPVRDGVEACEEFSLKEDKNNIKKQIRNVEYYIEQVLNVIRSNNYQEDLKLTEINIGEVIKYVIKKNFILFIEKDISINIGDLDMEITSDSKWMAYIIDQILNNSWKYTNQGGNINIDLEKIDGNIEIIIKDDGVGISQRNIDRVFDLGFNGDEGVNLSKSTGMGLYIVKKMCDELGYDISIESEKDKYTQVKIVIREFLDYLKIE